MVTVASWAGRPLYAGTCPSTCNGSTGGNGSGCAFCMRATPEAIAAFGRRALVGHEQAFATRVDQTLKWHLNRQERTFC